MILAIDPGPVESAYVLWDGSRLFDFGKVPNARLLELLHSGRYMAHVEHCAIEMIASFGMPVGASVFETCVWIGRFMQVFGADKCDRITRNTVKNHICHSSKARDGSVRQAIIDRFGGKERAVGRKANPGILHGVAGDVWQALAVCLTFFDQNKEASK